MSGIDNNPWGWRAAGQPGAGEAPRAGPPPARSFEQGFTNLDSEFLTLELPVEGRLPPWLSGTLFRNGPARFDLPAGGVGHWFDGLAMLHAFTFARGRVTYSNRFLQTCAYREARARGALPVSAFTADPCKSLFSRIFTALLPYQLDNANVGVAHVAGHFLAMTETPMAVEFDPQTLGTIGAFRARDTIRGNLTTAHPLYDRARGEWYNYLTRFGLPSRYQILTLGERRRLVSSVPVGEPAYMHSFAMTERYLILGEFPFRLNLGGILSAEVPLIGFFRWRPERPTRFLVIDKDDGALVGVHESDPCFGFHHVNAYETGEGICLDVIVYPDPAVIDHLYLDAIRQSDHFPSGELRRYLLPWHGEGRAERIAPLGLELPQIDERRRGRPYRYVYGVGVSEGGVFLDQIVRVDTRRREARAWHEPGCYPGEPIFVPSPDSDAEGAGLLLSIVLDGRSASSFLLALDAASLQEVARARARHHIPFGFHGLYVPDGGVRAA